MIWLDSIFCSLAMWVAEKIPKLWKKDQQFASDVSTSTARDATLCSVVFDVTSMPFNGKGFVGRNISARSSLQNLFRDDHTIYGKNASRRSRIV